MNNDQKTKAPNQNQGMKPDANKSGQPQQQPMKNPKQDIAGGTDRGDLQSQGTGKFAPGQGQSGSKVGKDLDVDRADQVSQRDTGGGTDVDDLDDDRDTSDKNGQPAAKTPPSRR